MKRRTVFLLCLSLLFDSAVSAEKSCNYQTYRWNTVTRQAVDIKSVSKPYSQLGEHEVDRQTGCSVCEEDQRVISIDGLPQFRMCRNVSGDIFRLLNKVVANGFTIKHLKGYRVGMTRGELDQQGRRTRFSNHSYGIAIDINSESNGLYENCLEFGEGCVLRRGGEWRPGVNPLSIEEDSLLVRLMQQNGFLWGGKIAGRQKDYMHFSISGY